MPAPLTERQNAAYEYIVAYAREHRTFPTLREIGAALGIVSSNGVTKMVDALVRKGYLTRLPNVARGLRLTDTAPLAGGGSDDAPLLPLIGRASSSGAARDLRRRPERFYALDAQLLPRSTDPADCLMVRAGDDGMSASGIRKGDLVVVEEMHARDLHAGDVAAFLVGDAVRIRAFTLANGTWHLRAADARYTDETFLPGTDACALVGRAVAVIRRLG